MKPECEEKKLFVGYEIKSLDHMIKRHVKRTIKEKGFPQMTVMHSWIIGFLANNEDRQIFQRDLEKEFNIGRSSITGMLQLMEQKGYIIREQVQGDARLKKISLTDKGRQHIQLMHDDRERLEEIITNGLSMEEVATFQRIIDKMKENLTNAGIMEEKEENNV